MKRSEKANWQLRKRRPLFFQIGLILSISAALYAFNFRSEVQDYYVLDTQKSDDWDIEVMPEFREEKRELKKPTPIHKKNPSIAIGTEPDIRDNNTPEGEPELNTDTGFVVWEHITGPELVGPETVIFAQVMPKFPGGEEAMLKFIYSQIKYPDYAKQNGCQGKVVLSFVVNAEGFVTEVKPERDPGCGLAEEAMRVFKMMPRWKPGSNNFRPVRVRLWAPVVFELN